MEDDINIEHPAYYNVNGIELMQVMKDLPYCRGCAIKYLFRAGVKDPDKEIEDLRKCLQMVQFEIDRVTEKQNKKRATN